MRPLEPSRAQTRSILCLDDDDDDKHCVVSAHLEHYLVGGQHNGCLITYVDLQVVNIVDAFHKRLDKCAPHV